MNDDPRQHQDLADVVGEILASYDQLGNINRLDGSNLPSRAEVSLILDDLISLVFPGFHDQSQVDRLTSPYFVGERCARTLRALERSIERANRVACRGKDGSSGPPTGTPALDLLAHIPAIRTTLAADVRAALDGDPAACNASEVITAYPGIQAIAAHRLSHFLYRANVPLLPRLMSEIVHGRTGIDIHPGATIGASFFIDHGTGVVIGETCEIGEGVKLYQGVTLGALSVDANKQHNRTKRHPTLENGVTVYAGATILGGETTIGAGSTIGGNVWLTHSVPPNTQVMLDQPSLRFVRAEE